MKHYLLAAMLLAAATQASAYQTKGDGTVYSFSTLSQIAASGVEPGTDGSYTLTASDTIAVGDKFIIDDKPITVCFADGVSLVIEGEADLRATQGATFSCADGQLGVGIVVGNGLSSTPVANCNFIGVGLKGISQKGMTLRDCLFSHNNGLIGGAALTLGTDGAPYEVRSCTFEYNDKAAVAGAANYRNPLVIEDCLLLCNGQSNRNIPQLNLTVADSVVIRRCTITGDPEKTMVGGIVVANLLSFRGDFTTIIEDNTITDNRFGIATYLHQQAFIRGNRLVGNNHETNPMNGGSGINVYDPYNTQYTYIEGNHIEGSLWGITLVGGKEANLGRTEVAIDAPGYNPGCNVFRDNGNGGVLYDLYNNSANTVYAQGNLWNVVAQTAEEIEGVVFHKADDARLGEVIYMPAGSGSAGVSTAQMPSGVRSCDRFDLLGRASNAHRKAIYVEGGKKVAR